MSVREIDFDDLPRGGFFRFYSGDNRRVAQKVFFRDGEEGALILDPVNQTWGCGGLATADELRLEKLIELPGMLIRPSMRAGTVMSGAGHIADPGEIELRGSDLLLVIELPMSGKLRVNISSGEITNARGARPAEIYSEWSWVRTGDLAA